MFLQTYSNLNIMLNKNDDVKRNMSKIYILNIFLKLMMLNTMFMFHYQLNQNTGCKVQFVVNMKRQPKRLSNRRHRRRSEQPFYLPRVYPWVTPPMTPG